MALEGLTLDVQEGEICVVLEAERLRQVDPPPDARRARPADSGERARARPRPGQARAAGPRATAPEELLGYADQHYWRAPCGRAPGSASS